MELRQIRYFIQVVQLGSVSKAARALNMAQPALSRHIQSLEHGLGASLLIRTTRVSRVRKHSVSPSEGAACARLRV
jgi:DNA-binding transcriptional LysR family regulator